MCLIGLLSHVVEEAFEAHIEHIVFINGRGKGEIEDYFDHHIELEHQLESKEKSALLHEARRYRLIQPFGHNGFGGMTIPIIRYRAAWLRKISHCPQTVPA